MLQISFIIVLFMLLFIKSPLYLGGFLGLLILASIKNSFNLIKRVLKSIFLFNISITIGYAIMGIFKNIDVITYLIYINLKVFTITYFVFLFFSKVDMIKFFSFSKELSFLLTMTLSQIFSYKKTFEDFRLAYKARVIKKIKDREKGFITKTFDFFFKKALKDSKERTLAMKARGFLND
jgi:cobalt/nickel transport system permease protein